MQHIGGSSRVIQEADNVLAIQRHRDEVDKRKFRKFLYVSQKFALPIYRTLTDPQKSLWYAPNRIRSN